jgi:hypothetical protein
MKSGSGGGLAGGFQVTRRLKGQVIRALPLAASGSDRRPK